MSRGSISNSEEDLSPPDASSFEVLSSPVRALSAASDNVDGSALGSEASWEVLEAPSSGPSSAELACLSPCAAGSERPAESVPSVAGVSQDDSVSVAFEVDTEAGEEESEPDDGLDGFAEADLIRRPRPGTAGGRDLRRRAKRQARGHALDARADNSMPAMLARVHRKHGDRMAKAELARMRKADTKYRVEERRFKRRYRDWCCFHGTAPAMWSRSSALLAAGATATSAFSIAPVPWPAAAAATTRPTLTAVAAPPTNEPPLAAEAAKQPAAAEPRGSLARDFMDAYSAVAYWRTIGLLQESYGHGCPLRNGVMLKSAGVKLALLKKQIISKAALVAMRARSKRLASRFNSTRRRPTWLAWEDADLDCKFRGGRSFRRRTWNKVFKQKLRSALRGAPSGQQTSSALVTKLGLREGRRAASQARDKNRSAQRDFKYSEASSACVAPSTPAASTTSAESSKKHIAKGPCSSKSGASRSLPSRAGPQSGALETEDVSAGWPASSRLGAEAGKRDKPTSWALRPVTDVENGRSGEAAGLADEVVIPAVGDLDRDISECVDPEAGAARDADDVTGLISVWEHLDEFRFTPVPDDDGKLLVPALKSSAEQPSVATQETFLRRFQARTAGVFTGVDWSNLRAIGGMMLACLVAGDADFRKGFAETDVDIYVVGLSGSAFMARIARFVEEVYVAANVRGFDVVVLRTPCTITLSLHCPYRDPLPNVQIIMSPFASTRHLLETTDIDCTGFGFNGERLLSTQSAREAVAHRRVMARPEKYGIRGEWSTESRLLKYAMRGFRVVDPGLRPDAKVPNDAAVSAIAKQASAALLDKAFDRGADGLSLDATAMKHERMVRATGVNGAHLLLLAQQNPGLRELLLFDVPLLPAGLGKKELLATLRACDASSLKEDGYGRTLGRGGELPKGKCKLKALYPSISGMRLKDVVMDAIQVRNPDGSLETRSWYNGLADGALRAVAGGSA